MLQVVGIQGGPNLGYHISLLHPRRGAKYRDHRVCMSVCEFVCLSARISQKITCEFHENFCTCYLWPRRECNMSCTGTSGFVDDDTRFHISLMGMGQRSELLTVTRQMAPLSCAPGEGEDCYHRVACFVCNNRLTEIAGVDIDGG